VSGNVGEFLKLPNCDAKLHNMGTLDWDNLRIFLSVARTRSFNAASRKTPLNQSTISRHILKLERELGLTLFNRTPRGIYITPVGEAIIELVSDMEGRVKLIEARVAQEMGLSGKIRLWVSEGIGGYWLPPRLKEFHRRYPGVTIEVLCSTEMPAIGSRDVDISLSWHKPEHPDTVVLSVNSMTLKPCASVEYLDTFGHPKNFDDLIHHRLCDHLHYPKDGAWSRWADMIEASRHVAYVTNSSWALGEATKNGVGISLQPVGVQHREPNLRILDLDGFAAHLKFWLTCHRNLKDVPRIRALINYIKSEVFRNPIAGTAFAPD
jgi:DNA-binding transcriptional LysR family regulator